MLLVEPHQTQAPLKYHVRRRWLASETRNGLARRPMSECLCRGTIGNGSEAETPPSHSIPQPLSKGTPPAIRPTNDPGRPSTQAPAAPGDEKGQQSPGRPGNSRPCTHTPNPGLPDCGHLAPTGP